VRESPLSATGRGVVLNFPALDVAIGLVFIFFVLAIVCSGINEAIASSLRWRSQDLERGLWELLHDPDLKDAPEKAGKALAELKAHPLIKPMLNPGNKGSAQALPPMKGGRPKTSRKTDLPSYIPSRTFAAALLGLGQASILTAGDVRKDMRKLEQSIQAIPSKSVQEALLALLHDAQGDAVAFRRNVERWYDDQMERVSGWYRKRIQKVLWILAFAVAIAINADTLQMGKRLWVDPSVRASLVSQAENASSAGKDTSPKLDQLTVPLGWHLATQRHDPQGFPIYKQWSSLWALLSKVIGLTITAVAISFGAPFWFDTLSKLSRLRNGGAPPPASDAIRRGEGEETRAGPGAAVGAAPPEEPPPSTETGATPAPQPAG
jgi:hypothetical protein